MRNNEVMKDQAFDTNIGFLRDPYRFLSRKLDRYETDALETKLLFFKNAVILRGEEGAKLFYDKTKFTRVNVMPGRVQKPLFGRGTIHGTDLEQHEQRKQLFLGLLKPPMISNFPGIFERHWYEALQEWQKKDSIVLLDEVSELICRAMCEWTGFELAEEDIHPFTIFNRRMVESIGEVGIKHWHGRWARVRAEVWIGNYIREIRKGKRIVDENSAIYKVAMYRENGKLLGPRQAAVTFLNVIRPAIAAARFVVFGALALHDHPEYKERLSEEKFRELWAHEVRRFYPFVPGMAAKAREEFTWKGYTFKKNAFALLDIFGTNHDPKIWKKPDEFSPERFLEWNGSPFNFIPQGGGHHDVNHRCPGEWLTVEIIKKSMEILVLGMNYDVPEQDLEIEFGKLITQPRSGFIMNHVRPASQDSYH